MKTKGNLYPHTIYMVNDDNHVSHFYESDPMRTEDRESAEINIGEVISDFVGEGSVMNPVLVALNCAKLERSEPFAVSQPGAVRCGTLKKHFEDMAGHIVDVLDTRNDDANFPFNGVLLTREGKMVGTATYSLKGECSDGVESHNLVLVEGVFPEKKDEQEGEKKDAKKDGRK